MQHANNTAKNIYLSLENFALVAFEGNAMPQEENGEIVTAALDHHAKKKRGSRATPFRLFYCRNQRSTNNHQPPTALSQRGRGRNNLKHDSKN